MDWFFSKRAFFGSMGVLMTLLVLAGFVPTSLARLENGTFDILHMIHGPVFLAWYLLFTVQALLIRNQNIELHKIFGKASTAVAMAMVVLGMAVAQHSWISGSTAATPFGRAQFIMLPFADILLFVVFYIAGLSLRKRGDWHKRLMLFAGLVMIGAALARLAATITGFIPLGMVGVLGLVGLVMVFDRRTIGHIHMVTWLGLAALLLRQVAIQTVATTQRWEQFVTWMFGPYTGG